MCRKCAGDRRDSIFGYGKRGSLEGLCKEWWAWMRNVRGWYIKMKQLERDYETNTVPTKTQLSNFLGTPGEDYF